MNKPFVVEPKMGRCATCRHARPTPGPYDEPYALPLNCAMAGGHDGYHGGEEYDLPPRPKFALDVSEFGRLRVAPDFGCVMWEAKP